MYLVICKSKVTGLSIEDYVTGEIHAGIICDRCNDEDKIGNTYHVRHLPLDSINLEELMKGGEG